MKDLLPSLLHTKDKTSIVAAINELVSKVGAQDLSDLDTVTKDSLIGAINELMAKIDSATVEIDALTDQANEHISNDKVHVTTEEKYRWNAKANEADVTNKINGHKDEAMPHKFVKDGKSYRYGFSANDALDGLVFHYEEVTV